MRPAGREQSRPAVARINGEAYVVDMQRRVLWRVGDPDDVVDFDDDNLVELGADD